MRLVLLAGATMALAGCGKIATADDAEPPDTGPDAVVEAGADVSVWQCGWNFDGGLSLQQGPQVVTCDDATKAACQAWGQTLVQTGVVYTYCDDVDPVHRCVLDDVCTQTKNGLACSCGNVGCPWGNNQVCVSDTPTSAKKCVPPCSQ